MLNMVAVTIQEPPKRRWQCRSCEVEWLAPEMAVSRCWVCGQKGTHGDLPLEWLLGLIETES